MSTILKALRRLEEDDGQRPSSDTRIPADTELRERILAEESAAESVEPPVSEDSRFSLAAWTARVPVASRSLLPIGLVVALLLFVGAGVWYWTGRAGSLEPVVPDTSPLFAERIPIEERPAPGRVAPPLPPIEIVPESEAESMPARSRTAAAVPPADAESVEAAAVADDGSIGASPAQPLARTEPSEESGHQAAGTSATPVPVPVPLVVSDGGGGDSKAGLAARDSGATPLASSTANSASVPSASSPSPSPSPAETPSTAAPSPSPVAQAAPPKPAAPRAEASLARNEPRVSSSSPQSASSRPAAAPGESRPAQGRAPVSASRTPSTSPARDAAPSRAASPEVERLDHRGLPDITVTRTAWHPTPTRRSAKVRLESTDEFLTLHEGDAVGGLVVQEITPSSVVFSTGDVEIRRRVGQGATR
jgi:hypothetical protein